MNGKFKLVNNFENGQGKFVCDCCGDEKVVNIKSLKHYNCRCFTDEFIFKNYNHIADIEILKIIKNAPKKKDVLLTVKCKICSLIRVVSLKDIENGVGIVHFKACNNPKILVTL